MEYLNSYVEIDGERYEVEVDFEFTPCDGGDRFTPPSGIEINLISVIDTQGGEDLIDEIDAIDERRLIEECVNKAID